MHQLCPCTTQLTGRLASSTQQLQLSSRHGWQFYKCMSSFACCRAFSTYYLHGYHSSAQTKQGQSTPARTEPTLRRPRGRSLQQFRQQLPDSQQMALTAFEFVVKHMHDPSTDMFHWTTTQDGQLLQDNKVIYGQWFVLYAFR